ncbi:hypothetical protein C4J81_02230 [Deltaproteobacteria bacterium Smac51]|nr:hypothetical protein C4J81_02230 [Deltaproteobacteria bacterium Smac51]
MKKLTFKIILRGFIVLFAVLIILFLAVFHDFPPIAPDIVVHNKTDKVVYFRPMQFIRTNKEVTDEEVAQIKNYWKLQPGEKRRFSAYLSSLTTSLPVYFTADWDIGSRSGANGSGGHSFDMERHGGTCRVKIEIYDDKYKVIPEDKIYCHKKLTSSSGRMDIRSEKQTITNYYGANTDHIKKQTIRQN